MPQGMEVQVLSRPQKLDLDRLAQLVERCAYIAKVGGSRPSAVTEYREMGW